MDRLRAALFLGVFVVVLLVHAAIYVPYLLNQAPVAVAALDALIRTSPVLTGDVAAFGEYTPPILAGIMASFAPPRKNSRLFIVAIVLAILSYFLYVHLTVFFDSGPGQGLLSIDRSEPEKASKIMAGLVASIRTFCIVTAAGMIGIKLNKNMG